MNSFELEKIRWQSQPVPTSAEEEIAWEQNAYPGLWERRKKYWKVGLFAAGGTCALAVFIGLLLTASGWASSTTQDPTWLMYTNYCREQHVPLEQIFIVPEGYSVLVSLTDAGLFDAETRPPYRFRGNSSVTFTVSNSTQCIGIHSHELRFSSIGLYSGSDVQDGEVLCHPAQTQCPGHIVAGFLPGGRARTSEEEDVMLIHRNGKYFEKGTRYTLQFEYSGNIGESPSVVGLHRSAPFAVCGNDTLGKQSCAHRVLLTSQLERLGARRVFPAVDVPWAKATFDVHVEVPVEHAPVVLSNTYIINEQYKDDYKIVSFAQTVKMSPYLVAIAVGMLSVAPGNNDLTDGSFHVQGWTVPGREGLITRAVEIGKRALEFYEDSFGVQQPVRQYDFVAIPGKHGAMENWGLITFDELRALRRDNDGSIWDYEVASVVCHELAHQHIGNLVTCKDWNNLALNEAGAVSVEYACMEHVDARFSSKALQFLAVKPGGVRKYAHDGPFIQNLRIDNPIVNRPLIPSSDLDINEDIVYARGAALFLSLGRAFAPYPKIQISALKKLLENHAFSTASVVDYLIYAAEEELVYLKGMKEMDSEEKAVRTDQLERILTLLKLDFEERDTARQSRIMLADTLYVPNIPRVYLPENHSSGPQAERFCPYQEASVLHIAANPQDVSFACGELLNSTVPISLLESCGGIRLLQDTSGTDSMFSKRSVVLEKEAQTWVIGDSPVWNTMRVQYPMNHLEELASKMKSNETCGAEQDEWRSLFASKILLDQYSLAKSGHAPLNHTLLWMDRLQMESPPYHQLKSGIFEYLVLHPMTKILSDLGGQLASTSVYSSNACKQAFWSRYDVQLATYLDHIMKEEIIEEIFASQTIKINSDVFLRRMALPDLLSYLAGTTYSFSDPQIEKHGYLLDIQIKIRQKMCDFIPGTPWYQEYMRHDRVVNSTTTVAQISADIVPAVYSSLFADNGLECLNYFLDEKATSTRDVTSSFISCYQQDPSYPIAYQCLMALAYVQDYDEQHHALEDLVNRLSLGINYNIGRYNWENDIVELMALIFERNVRVGFQHMLDMKLKKSLACNILDVSGAFMVHSEGQVLEKVLKKYRTCPENTLHSLRAKLEHYADVEKELATSLCSYVSS